MTSTTLTATTLEARGCRFVAPYDFTANSIGVNLSTAGGASATLTMGVYTASSNTSLTRVASAPYPTGQYLSETGAVVGLTTTGVKRINFTSAFTFTAGTVYYLVVYCEVPGGLVYTANTVPSTNWFGQGYNTSENFQHVFGSTQLTSGVLASSLTIGSTAFGSSTAVPTFLLR
jgi:hypothetical protein